MKVITNNIKAALHILYRSVERSQINYSTIKACCIIGTLLLLSAGATNAQRSVAGFVLNNSQNPLKNFVVTSRSESRPVFVDINGDGNLDCFSGEYSEAGNATISFFKNEGNNSSPVFKQINGTTNPLAKVSIQGLTVPYFVDIDKDGDYDCFIGDASTGGLRFYKNVRTGMNPVFEKQTAALNPLSMVKFSAAGSAEPAFVDIDSDGDYDCLVTDSNGDLYFYKNVGISASPFFERVSGDANPFGFLEASRNKPSFYDWNGDGLVDLFVGTKYYKNIGSTTKPAFALNTNESPKFSGIDNGYPLRWVNFGGDKSVAIITGTPSGEFNYFTAVSSESIVLNTSGKVYPNPSKDQFLLSLPARANTETVIRITDAQGRVIETQKSGSNLIKFGKELKSGVYFMEVLQNEKVVSRQKIVKEL